MGKISKLVAQRCPRCSGTEARRSPRKGFFELVVLSGLGIRPFRCHECANRFYAFKLRNVGSTGQRRWRSETEEPLTVWVYGHEPDHEPFQEQSDVRVLGMHSAQLRLVSKVRAGQELVLLDPASDGEQRCRVKSVTGPPDGESVVSVEFRDSVLEFWINVRPPAGN
jgi:hypothetical protein